MDNKSYLENKVQGALNSLDGLQPAQSRPFFYTRLRARMVGEERNVWENISRIISRPAITILGLLLVVLLNTIVVFKKETTIHTSLPDQSEMAFTNEYEQANSFFYDIENDQP